MHYEITDPDTADLTKPLTGAQQVFQLRCQQRYRGGPDQRWFDRWRDGDRTAPRRAARPWIDHVLAPAAAAGHVLRLVHVVTGPVDPYTAFLMECYRHRHEAGETIRVIGVPTGQWPAGIGRQDTALADDTMIYHCHDDDGRLHRMEVTDDPAQVAAGRAVQWLALGRGAALPATWIHQDGHRP